MEKEIPGTSPMAGFLTASSSIPEPADNGVTLSSSSPLTSSTSSLPSEFATTENEQTNDGKSRKRSLTPQAGSLSNIETLSNQLNAFRSIFKGLPEEDVLITDFACAIHQDLLQHGRLYLTNKHVCFHSNFLGWETVLTIRYADIVCIQKAKTAFFFPNAIRIATKFQKHNFSQFLSRDTAYAIILDRWRIEAKGSVVYDEKAEIAELCHINEADENVEGLEDTNDSIKKKEINTLTITNTNNYTNSCSSLDNNDDTNNNIDNNNNSSSSSNNNNENENNGDNNMTGIISTDSINGDLNVDFRLTNTNGVLCNKGSFDSFQPRKKNVDIENTCNIKTVNKDHNLDVADSNENECSKLSSASLPSSPQVMKMIGVNRRNSMDENTFESDQLKDIFKGNMNGFDDKFSTLSNSSTEIETEHVLSEGVNVQTRVDEENIKYSSVPEEEGNEGHFLTGMVQSSFVKSQSYTRNSFRDMITSLPSPSSIGKLLNREDKDGWTIEADNEGGDTRNSPSKTSCDIIQPQYDNSKEDLISKLKEMPSLPLSLENPNGDVLEPQKASQDDDEDKNENEILDQCTCDSHYDEEVLNEIIDDIDALDLYKEVFFSDFWSNFLLEVRGCRNLEMSTWTNNEDGFPSRTVNFITPVAKNPVGPREAPIISHQVQTHGQSKYSRTIEETSQAQGIVYSDYFQTINRFCFTRIKNDGLSHDLLLDNSIDGKNDEDCSETSKTKWKARLRITTHINWVKSPFGPIKGIIYRETIKQVIDQFRQLFNSLLEHLDVDTKHNAKIGKLVAAKDNDNVNTPNSKSVSISSVHRYNNTESRNNNIYDRRCSCFKVLVSLSLMVLFCMIIRLYVNIQALESELQVLRNIAEERKFY